jgi:hypothetical protein
MNKRVREHYIERQFVEYSLHRSRYYFLTIGNAQVEDDLRDFRHESIHYRPLRQAFLSRRQYAAR